MTMVASTVGFLWGPLAVAALWVLPNGSGRPRRRMPQVVVPARARRGLVVSLGAAAAVVLVRPSWAVPGILAAIVLGVIAGRRTSRPDAAVRSAVREEIAVYCSLLACCLESGMPTGAAMIAIGESLRWGDEQGVGRSGPDQPATYRQALESVAALSALGAGPEMAWEPAAAQPDLAGLAAIAGRSDLGGTALAAAVRRHGSQLRVAAAAQVHRRSGRAAVLIAAPLGLCFLPAFICLGLVPVVIGLLGGLHL